MRPNNCFELLEQGQKGQEMIVMERMIAGASAIVAAVR
jgi:hypothetical protein